MGTNSELVTGSEATLYQLHLHIFQPQLWPFVNQKLKGNNLFILHQFRGVRNSFMIFKDDMSSHENVIKRMPDSGDVTKYPCLNFDCEVIRYNIDNVNVFDTLWLM